MSSIARPPEPWLVAIILIVQSRAGPRCVFHTPANPDLEKLIGPNLRRGRGLNEVGSDEESESSSEEEDEDPTAGGGAAAGSSTSGRQNNANVDDNNSTTTSSAGGESQRPPSLNSGKARKKAVASELEENPDLMGMGRGGNSSANYTAVFDSVFGLPSEVWEKLLSPSRAWHKRRFEIGINDLAFVGWPVFVRDDGYWRKKSRRRKRKKPKSDAEGNQYGSQDMSNNEELDDPEQDPKHAESASDNEAGFYVIPPAGEEHSTDKMDRDDSVDSQTGSPEADKDTMSMFNVVFVMAPPILEYSIHLKEMYEHVIKKFSKALKYEQDHSDYVWKEAQHILQIKERARERGMSFDHFKPSILEL